MAAEGHVAQGTDTSTHVVWDDAPYDRGGSHHAGGCVQTVDKQDDERPGQAHDQIRARAPAGPVACLMPWALARPDSNAVRTTRRVKIGVRSRAPP